MVRIDGVNLPLKKRVEYGLTYIFGIGVKRSRDILSALKISFDKRVESLSDVEIAAIQKEISTNYLTEGDLRKELRSNIARLQNTGSYRGLRHKKGLPCRGQRTKTNARTRKGPRKQSIPMKKTVSKK